ncbi:amidohydrolase family protein [Pseudomonas fluorescens]|uniref:4-sulfomuconolactone hydrolase n=1 Tax=Pseudomonas fluorescens TaxID=294 RepID=A0A5E7A285_PSEFL|nr:amidohydrolase family protein [Pseudomonas fluorescens]VVN70994.1 4-sulfomuconolactone hydrolase [Pseudomonas fluorescens]
MRKNIYDEPKIDCHNHVFDPVRFPYRANTIYRPSAQEVGTVQQFTRVMDAYGVRHALLVGPTSGYRTDNRYLLEALATGEGRFKGIAVVDDDIDIRELAALKEQGVVGVAFNPANEGLGVMSGVHRLFGQLAELDLFAQIQVQQDQLVELTDLLDRSRARLLIDHCGRPSALDGVGQPGFKRLLTLADSGRASVKLSGMQKFGNMDTLYEDTQVYVQALLSAFGAHACVWGSDWPFLREQARVDYGPLLKLAERFMPDPDVRRQVMWETPVKLFGFPQINGGATPP